MLISQIFQKLRRYLQRITAKQTNSQSYVSSNPSTLTCALSQSLSHLQILLWTNPELAWQRLQDLCGKSVASGAQWRSNKTCCYPKQGSDTMLNLWTINLQENMKVVGKELWSGIIKENVQWTGNSCHKFHINRTRIDQIITTLIFIH